MVEKGLPQSHMAVMTSTFYKSSLFPVHTNTLSWRFQIYPHRRAFSKSSVLVWTEGLSGLKKSAGLIRRSQVAGHRSQVAGHRSQVAGRRSQVAGRRSQVAGHRSQVTGRRSQVAGHRSQVAGRRSQVTGRRSHAANNR